MKQDWSKLKPFVEKVKNACGSGVMAVGVVMKSDIQNHFPRADRYGPTQSKPGGIPSRRSSQLHNSMAVEKAGPLTAKVGPTILYGDLQERGGTIRAKNVKNLRIPLNDAARRLSASKGTQSLRALGTFTFTRARNGKTIATGNKKVRVGTYYNDANGKRVEKRTNDQPTFLLTPSVTLPPRPFMKPALARATNNPSMVTEFCRAVNRTLVTLGITTKVRPA